MADDQDVRVVGERVEQLLRELRTGGHPDPAAAAEELTGALVRLYGAALERITGVVGEETLDKMLADPLVESLLIVHDLHPLDTDARIQRALDKVRPYLGSHAGGVEYRGVDDQGVVHLRLEGSCSGCPSSTVTVRLAIERAIAEAAPETTGLEVDGVVDEPAPANLLQIGRRPGLPPPAPRPTAASPATRPTAAGPAVAADAAGWVRLAGDQLAGGPRSFTVDGSGVLVLRVDSVFYAYRDTCPGCGSGLVTGALDGTLLTCPACAGRYDVRLAGAGLDDARLHLDPLPLLADDLGVRIAAGNGARP